MNKTASASLSLLVLLLRRSKGGRASDAATPSAERASAAPDVPGLLATCPAEEGPALLLCTGDANSGTPTVGFAVDTAVESVSYFLFDPFVVSCFSKGVLSTCNRSDFTADCPKAR